MADTKQSRLDFSAVAGTHKAVLMVESKPTLTEEQMLAAVVFRHQQSSCTEAIKEFKRSRQTTLGLRHNQNRFNQQSKAIAEARLGAMHTALLKKQARYEQIDVKAGCDCTNHS